MLISGIRSSVSLVFGPSRIASLRASACAFTYMGAACSASYLIFGLFADRGELPCKLPSSRCPGRDPREKGGGNAVCLDRARTMSYVSTVARDLPSPQSIFTPLNSRSR